MRGNLFCGCFVLFRHLRYEANYFVKILLSVPEIILFMFSRCRTITITGMAIAAINRGHKRVKFQRGIRAITRASVRGKATEAAMEAREIYRHIRTVIAHIKRAAAAQIV